MVGIELTGIDTVDSVDNVETVDSVETVNRAESGVDDLEGVPVDDYLRRGFKLRTRVMDGHKYIALYKGNKTVSLGRYTPEKWELLLSKVKQFQSVSHKDVVVESESDDVFVQRLVQGSVKGEGYLQELKDMIRGQIGRTGELTQLCFNLGLGVLAASLSRSGISLEQFKMIATQDGRLKEAFDKAAETVFKALEYYDQERIETLERERDEARVEYVKLKAEVEKLMKVLDPSVRLERMIHAYIGSGNVNPDALSVMVNKLLELESIKVVNMP